MSNIIPNPTINITGHHMQIIAAYLFESSELRDNAIEDESTSIRTAVNDWLKEKGVSNPLVSLL